MCPVVPFVVSLGLFMLGGIALGSKLGVPTLWLTLFGVLLSYYATTAYLRYVIARRKMETGTPATWSAVYPPAVRRTLFVWTPIACGLVMGLLYLFHTPLVVSLPVFFGVLLTGHWIGLAMSLR